MVAKIGRRGSVVDAVELFGGFGGTAQGIHKAGAEVRVAANHLKIACEVYGTNFPHADVRRADLVDPDAGEYVDPADLPAARVLFASPSCKDHSMANAQKQYARGPQMSLFGDEEGDVRFANSERSRVSMMAPLRYAAKHAPELVFVENVVEVCHWGPDRDGSTFLWWWKEWERLGYEHRILSLNSQFLPPTPQSRDRVYVICWKKGNAAPDLEFRPRAYCTSDVCSGKLVDAVQIWKGDVAKGRLGQPVGKYRQQYDYRCPECRAPVHPAAWPAYSVIDWSNLGIRIADRAALGMRPLAQRTIERIARALVKFSAGPPVLIPMKSTYGVDRLVTEPLTTQTAQQEKALLVTRGGIVPLRSGRERSSALDDPLATIMANGSAQLLASKGAVLPLAGNTFERPGYTRARSLVDTLFSLHATQAFGLAHLPSLVEMRGGGSLAAGQHAVSDPMYAVTAGGMHHMLVSPALFTKHNGGPADTAWHEVSVPLNTITGTDTHGLLVLPWLEQYMSDPASITDVLATVMTHLRHSLVVAPGDIEEPTADDLGEVRVRMLEPEPELQLGMGFEPDYVLLGNKQQKTAGLGNAVTPPVATWITDRMLATISGAGTVRPGARAGTPVISQRTRQPTKEREAS